MTTGAKAIKAVFESDGGRKVASSELLEFAKHDRDGYNELAALAAAEVAKREAAE
jgi:hypothetical protein